MPSLLDFAAARDKNLHQRGKLNFVLVYGVGLWGLSTTLVSTLIFALFAESTTTVRFALMAIIIFPALGTLLGLEMWKRLFPSNDSP